MAGPKRIDSVLPCLLSRLTDDQPYSAKESIAQRVTSMRKYREAVLGELADLLNSKAPPKHDQIYDFPEASESVLAYGVRDFSGTTSSDIGAREIESEFEHAIRLFEQRIGDKSLSVRLVSSSDFGAKRTLILEIEGELWALPAPDHLFVKTELDMETGHCEVGESSNG